MSELIPNNFYFVPFHRNQQNVADILLSTPAYNLFSSSVKPEIIDWTPIVLCLGKTEYGSYKFLVGDRIGYWHPPRWSKLIPVKDVKPEDYMPDREGRYTQR